MEGMVFWGFRIYLILIHVLNSCFRIHMDSSWDDFIPISMEYALQNLDKAEGPISSWKIKDINSFVALTTIFKKYSYFCRNV